MSLFSSLFSFSFSPSLLSLSLLNLLFSLLLLSSLSQSVLSFFSLSILCSVLLSFGREGEKEIQICQLSHFTNFSWNGTLPIAMRWPVGYQKVPLLERCHDLIGLGGQLPTTFADVGGQLATTFGEVSKFYWCDSFLFYFFF